MQANQEGSNAKPSLSWSQPTTQPGTNTIVPPVVVSTAPRSHVVTMDEPKSHTGTYIWIFIAGIIIGGLIAWGIVSSRNGGSSTGATATSTTSTSTNTATSTSTMQGTPSSTVDLSGSTASSGGFSIVSPQTAGFAVAVSNITVSQPTWIVVYEDRAGAPGNALGAALFLPQSQGTPQSGTVQLLRATLPNQNYLAGELIDNGDKELSLQNDKPVHDASGNIMLNQFTTK